MIGFRKFIDLAHLRSTLLGLLVCWQLVFIPLSNLVDAFPHRALTHDELSELREVYPEQRLDSPLIDAAARATDAWSRLTGQYQMWWLFAPRFPSQSVFPTVELRWGGEADSSPIHPPVSLRSAHDPLDPDAYVRMPSSLDRLFHYEVRLASTLAYWNEADVAPADQAAWRRFLRDCVHRQAKSISAYLRWRARAWQAEHADVPAPSELVLLVRIYPTIRRSNDATQARDPIEVPLARLPWNGSGAAAEVLSDAAGIEAYDPFAKRFVPITPGGGQVDE